MKIQLRAAGEIVREATIDVDADAPMPRFIIHGKMAYERSGASYTDAAGMVYEFQERPTFTLPAEVK